MIQKSDFMYWEIFDLGWYANLEFEEPERKIKMAELAGDKFLLTDKSKYDNMYRWILQPS